MEVLLTVRISDTLIQKAQKLEWIQAMTTGVDDIVNLPSLRKDVLLTSTRGIHGPQVSEMAFLLMLALKRNFPQNIHNQDQRVWQRWPGRLLYRKRMGILGVGVIGEEMARKCKSFGMTVYGIDIIKRKGDAVDHFCRPEDLLNIVPELDYFVIMDGSSHSSDKKDGGGTGSLFHEAHRFFDQRCKRRDTG